MDRLHALDRIRTHTTELVAERLRSESAVMARLRALIEEATRLGHAHRSIHASIGAGGLTISWNNYRVCLARARKRHLSRHVGLGQEADLHGLPSPVPASVHPLTQGRVVHEGSHRCVAEQDPGICAPTHVLAALAKARETAARDYARIARNLHRKGGR